MITATIVDDEPLCCESLATLLERSKSCIEKEVFTLQRDIFKAHNLLVFPQCLTNSFCAQERDIAVLEGNKKKTWYEGGGRF